jgi:hypothetical protein
MAAKKAHLRGRSSHVKRFSAVVPDDARELTRRRAEPSSVFAARRA